MMNNHISFSQINTYLHCPMRYYFRYIEKRIVPPQGFIVLGTGIHKGLEFNYKEKAKHKKEPSLKKILEYYDYGWEETKKQNEEWGIEWEEPEWKLKDTGVKLIEGYYEEVSPGIIPKSEDWVEKEFVIPQKNFPAIKGIIDLATKDKKVLDHKIAKRKKSPDEVSFDLQSLIYQVAYYYIEKELPENFTYDMLLKYKTPRYEMISIPQITPERLKWLEKVLQRAVQGIQNSLFFPIVSPLNCSWCGYKELCLKGKW